MRVIETAIPGLVIVEPRVFTDDRGFFFELWNARRYENARIGGGFLQDNVTVSTRAGLRGPHFQHPHGQAKRVSVLSG